VVVGILGELGKSVPSISMIPPLEFDWEIAKKVMPLTVVFVGMISFNNLCLLYVEVTFYQVVRSTTICFTIVFTYLILGQTTSRKAINASAVVMLGFLIGSVGEAHFSWLGVIFGVISSAFVSLYSIYVKKIMSVVNNDQWRLLIYNTILSIFFMFPTIYIAGETKGLRETDLLYELSTWVSMTVTGIFGFLINIAVFLQIKYTSPLTNNISGTLKACLQTIFAILIYRNPITFVNALGIILVIAGSFWYSNVRYAEMRDNQRKESNTPLPTVNPITKQPANEVESDD
jgi:GDP-fucose transporter C1